MLFKGNTCLRTQWLKISLITPFIQRIHLSLTWTKISSVCCRRQRRSIPNPVSDVFSSQKKSRLRGLTERDPKNQVWTSPAPCSASVLTHPALDCCQIHKNECFVSTQNPRRPSVYVCWDHQEHLSSTSLAVKTVKKRSLSKIRTHKCKELHSAAMDLVSLPLPCIFYTPCYTASLKYCQCIKINCLLFFPLRFLPSFLKTVRF